MKNSMRIFVRILIASLAVCANHVATAATCLSLTAGNWNTVVWSCGHVPKSTADDAVIATNVITPNRGTTINNLAIAPGVTLSDGGGGGNFTVAGNMFLYGTWAGIAAGRLQLNGSGGTLSGTGFIDNDTLRFSGGTNSIAAGTNITFTGATQVIDIRNKTTVTNNGTITVGRMTGQNNVNAVWTNAANSTLNVSQDLLTTGTLNAAATGNTLNYDGAAQTVKLPTGATYYHLTLSGSATKALPATALSILGNFTMAGTAATTAAGALTVGGNFDLGTGTTFNAGTFIHSVAGNFSNSGTFNPSTGQFLLNGSAVQTVTGVTMFYDLTVNNTAGITLANDITVNNLLTLTNGVVTTGANTLISANSCTLGVSRTNGWVAGTLQKTVPTGSPTCVFEIGDATDYRPVTLAFALVTTSGSASAWVSQTAGDHPNTTSAVSGIDGTASVNRYWTLASAGLVFTTATTTLTYLATDIDAGAAVASFVAALGSSCSGSGAARTCSAWTTYLPGVTPTSTQIVFGGVAAFGDVAVGVASNSNFSREPEFVYTREVY